MTKQSEQTHTYEEGYLKGYEQAKIDNRYPLDLIRELRRFVCASELVTAYLIGGNKVPKRYLDNLLGSQKQFDQLLETFN